jgi:hypothetical protein
MRKVSGDSENSLAAAIDMVRRANDGVAWIRPAAQVGCVTVREREVGPSPLW